MKSGFFTNYSEIKFIDRLKQNIDLCQSFCFSVSFIKKPGLRLLAQNIEAAIPMSVTAPEDIYFDFKLPV